MTFKAKCMVQPRKKIPDQTTDRNIELKLGDDKPTFFIIPALVSFETIRFF